MRQEQRDLSVRKMNPPEPPNPLSLKMREQDFHGPESGGYSTVARQALIPQQTFDLKAAGQPLATILDPLSIMGEQYRMLRSKLSLMQKETGLKTLLITSTVPNEGKTLVSCGLAAVLAQDSGRRVLLIDADLRKPDVSRVLGIMKEDRFEGLSQVLQGQNPFEEALLCSVDQSLYLMPSGPVPLNPAELLSTRYLELALRSAAKYFDWVVVDSPPVLPLADASLLAPLCDSALLVVNASSTPAKIIKSAIQTIGRDKFCGVVLNRMRDMRLSTYYHYYHQHHQLRRKS
jgi:capsular exopolysaccharide synthesis family protein